jgi:hypothetical protein
MSASKKSQQSNSKKDSKKTSGNSRPIFPTLNLGYDKSLWDKIYKILLPVLGLIMIFMAINSGLNADEEFQYDYSEKLVDYYSSFGADQAALKIDKGNMHYYGGLFDTVTGFVNQILGFEQTEAGYRQVRHIFIALFGWLALFFTAQLTRLIGGVRAAVLAACILFLSPRFLGHALMNPKDIPFAMGNIMAIYFLYKSYLDWPTIKWKHIAGLAGGIGIAIATRAGGLLLFAYMGLFSLLFLFLWSKSQQKMDWSKLVKGPIFKLTIGALAGYIIAVLFWPFALQSPINNPLEALTEFSKLGIRIRVLFEGENVMSDTTAVTYALKWVLITIPPAVILGFLLSLTFGRSFLKRYRLLPSFMLFFCFAFPLAYVMYKDSTLHDGWRHLIFLYPTLVIFAALSWDLLWDKFQDKKAILYGTLGVLVLLQINPARYIVMNAAYPYTYFNMIVGGVDGAFGNYETDYWGVSLKQAIEEMDERGYFPEGDTVMLVSHFSFSLQKYIQNKYQGRVKTGYVKYYSRYMKDWDYGIFPTRYIRSGQLRSGGYPTSRSLFTIDADNVPLLSVEKGGGSIFVGEQAIQNNDVATAAAAFEKELESYPNNPDALLGLTRANLGLQNWQKAVDYADDYIKLAPDYTQIYIFKGNGLLNMGKLSEAIKTFQRVLTYDPDYNLAYYYIAYCYYRIGDNNQALNNILMHVRANPRSKQGFMLASEIYRAMGDNANSVEMLNRSTSIRG